MESINQTDEMKTYIKILSNMKLSKQFICPPQILPHSTNQLAYKLKVKFKIYNFHVLDSFDSIIAKLIKFVKFDYRLQCNIIDSWTHQIWFKRNTIDSSSV